MCFFLLQQSTPVILFEEAVQDGEQFIMCTDKHTAHAWSTAVVPVNIEMIIFVFGGFMSLLQLVIIYHISDLLSRACAHAQ